ncbi:MULTISPECIES: alpha/beta hydrolase [unclassified Acidisoma]|jgi:esterase/lipase superfamily enzyme|uniref:alpha/beta hydrolase n=1 Tax=unclassified Acidisoma TaxID=2634065 RepID=UPI00131B0B3F|nr:MULTISPECIES: alpha/beta hydrolase [unclassified Acidisoma]
MATTVYFASNRILTGPADDPASYGPNIQPPSNSQSMVYGTAFVNGVDIPTNNPGVITAIEETTLGRFPTEAAADLSQPGRNLLVFIHGFDNTFTDAITQAAFNREWMAASRVLAANDAIISFSWPSLGKIVEVPILPDAYKHDQAMAQHSGIHLMSFFAKLEPILRTARANKCRTFLLAHSMGNLALNSAVENWFLHGQGDAALFDLTILAAADCGFDAFDQPNMLGLSGLVHLTDRVSIYYSDRDDVLKLSQVVNLAQRMGQDGPRDRANAQTFPVPPYTMFDAATASDYPAGFLESHQYYRRSQVIRTAITKDMQAAT